MWKDGVRIYDTLLFYIYDDFYHKFKGHVNECRTVLVKNPF